MNINYTKGPINKANLLLLSLFVLTFAVQSCKKSRSDMGKELFSRTKNKLYKDVTPEGFAPVFQKLLEEKKSTLNNGGIITAYYESHDFDPVLLLDHLPKDDVKWLPYFLNKANDHGLDPKLFKTKEIDSLLDRLYGKKTVKTLDEAYSTMAQVELLMANGIISYSNDLQFGILNPRKIYQRYYTKTLRPDTAFMTHVFEVKNFKAYFDSIQPQSPQYKAIQQAMVDGYVAPGQTKEETQRTLVANLERLRWKNKPTESRYVIVNIADFSLNVMNNGKSELAMKVCVGEGRNKDAENTLVEYSDDDKIDRPFSRETPQLNSMINMAQANPIWNIPESIANKEIIVAAKKDPYYLAGKNINVYKGGQLVEDPETIDWDGATASEYSFKQQPGADNSLGKIKFLFPNSSSVYLHDTPAQLPFKQEMRAVSHGCVRLEKPLEFARALFGDGTEKFKRIETLMSQDKSEPTDLVLPKKVPVYLTYITCWVDEAGKMQIRPDVYGLDIVLYGHLQKIIRG